MNTASPHYNETCDKLALLLITLPRPGWEQEYEELIRREVARLAPRPRQEESPVAGPSKRGVKDGTQDKEHSADEAILH